MMKILFTGGGSAGHVVPNLALIHELRAEGKADVCYIGTNGLEKSLVLQRKIPFHEIVCPKLTRGGGVRGFWRNTKIPVQFFRAVREAEEGLRAFRPDVVFSKGGYVALPVVFAARKLKIPCFAHESDFSLGLANRLSAKKCDAVFTSFPETAQTLKNGRYVGALLHPALFEANEKAARKTFGIPEQAKVLLVFGGGSGSTAINEALRARLPRLTKKYFVLHVCGKGNLVQTNIPNYRQESFLSDMGSAYACADLILSRAGAGAVFETLALHKPALFVPLEGATRGDQKENAAYFARKGLCRILPQAELSSLADAVDDAFADEGLRERVRGATIPTGNHAVLQALRRAAKR